MHNPRVARLDRLRSVRPLADRPSLARARVRRLEAREPAERHRTRVERVAERRIRAVLSAHELEELAVVRVHALVLALGEAHAALRGQLTNRSRADTFHRAVGRDSIRRK